MIKGNVKRIENEVFYGILEMQDRVKKLSYCETVFTKGLVSYIEYKIFLEINPDPGVFWLMLNHCDQPLVFFLKIALCWKTDHCLKMLCSALRFCESSSRKLLRTTFELALDCERVMFVFNLLRNVELPVQRGINFDIPFRSKFDWQQMLRLLVPKIGSENAEDWAKHALKAKNYSLAAHILFYLNTHHAKVCVSEELCNLLRSHTRANKSTFESRNKVPCKGGP